MDRGANVSVISGAVQAEWGCREQVRVEHVWSPFFKMGTPSFCDTFPEMVETLYLTVLLFEMIEHLT